MLQRSRARPTIPLLPSVPAHGLGVENAGAIPPILHFAWLGDKPLPDRARWCMDTWIDQHPQWQYRIWHDNNLPRMLNTPLYRAATNPGEWSDMLRLELLCEYGGVWVDCDVECYRPIDPLLQGVSAFVSASNGHIENAVMGAAAYHSFFERLRHGQALWNAYHQHDGVVWRGPRWVEAMTRLWSGDAWDLEAWAAADKPTTVGGLTVLPEWAFYKKTERSYGLHQWANSWVPEGMNPLDVGRRAESLELLG